MFVTFVFTVVVFERYYLVITLLCNIYLQCFWSSFLSQIWVSLEHNTHHISEAVICGLAKVPPDCKYDRRDQEDKSVFQPNLLKTARRLAAGSKTLKPESVFPPLVPSSMTSLIFAFSAAFLRGFLAGGGVYAASGSDHISGYTSLYAFCSPVGIVKRSDRTNLSAGICNFLHFKKLHDSSTELWGLSEIWDEQHHLTWNRTVGFLLTQEWSSHHSTQGNVCCVKMTLLHLRQRVTLWRVQSLRTRWQEAGHGPLDHLPGLNLDSISIIAWVTGRDWPSCPYTGHLHETPTHVVILLQRQHGKPVRWWCTA